MSRETTVDRVRVNSDLDAVLAAFSLRLLYPPLHPARDAGSGARGAWAAYVALRGGLAGPVNRDAFGQVEARAENAGVGDRFGQLFGAAIGVDLGPHLGLELPFAGYEMALELPGVGIIGEYALYVIIPQVRLRYPLLGDRLEVHVTAGVGPTYGEFNDRKPVTKGIGATRGGELGVGGIVGAGVEYFVTRNVALGCQAQYLVDRSHGLEVGGTEHAANLDSLLLALTLRVTLFESARSVPRWLAP